jgi:hypothetical protein
MMRKITEVNMQEICTLDDLKKAILTYKKVTQ